VNRFSKFTRPTVFAIIILTVAVAAVGFFVVRSDIENMRRAGRENLLWDASQVEVELMRLQRLLADVEHNDPNSATPDQVNDRFDILWSRVALFQQGAVGARLTAYDSASGTVARLFAAMMEVEPLVVGLKEGDHETAQQVQAVLAPFSPELRNLIRTVLHGEEEINAELRENLSNSSTVLTALSIVAVFASMLMIFMFARDSNRFRALAEANANLLAASDRASQAKSKFLAMMSHELRTPMNGVLGHLALVKQRGLSPNQDRLIEQAERSGQQMISLLADILDFSALQDDRLKLESKPFDPRDLVAAVGDTFRPVASREGIEFSAHASDDCPSRVIGDFGRLRQALTHLATYLLETAGTRNLALEVGYRDGWLNVSLSFAYSQSGGEWYPELIMGETREGSDVFASEALGPAVSRGLIKRMGGCTKLDTPSDDRIAVLVGVPARELVLDVLLIRTICQSSALEAICKASFRREDIRFLDEDSTLQPHVVMLEAGGEQEVAQVAKAVAAYPEAILVALGRPRNPDDFDDIVDVPIDVSYVRTAGFMNRTKGMTNVASSDNLRYAK